MASTNPDYQKFYIVIGIFGHIHVHYLKNRKMEISLFNTGDMTAAKRFLKIVTMKHFYPILLSRRAL